MAKRGLEKALQRNASLCERCFVDVNDAAPEAEKEEAEKEAEPSEPGVPLWSRPPVATDAVPTRATLILGHGVPRLAAADVRRALEQRGVAVETSDATQGEERLLAKTAPRGVVCVMGHTQAIVDAIDGIMERPDRDDMQLAFLPLEHYQILSDVGINGPQDGLDAMLSGRLRGIDVFKIEEMGAGNERRVWHSVGMNSLGSLTNTFSSMKKFERVIGKSAVIAASVYGSFIMNASYLASIQVPEGEVDADYRQLLAQEREYRFVRTDQTQYTWAKKPLLSCPTAQLDDGLFELVLTKAGPRGEFLQDSKQWDATGRLEAVFGKDAYRSCVRVSSVVISNSDTRSANMMCMGSSQVVKEVSSKVRISAVPRALKMFC